MSYRRESRLELIVAIARDHEASLAATPPLPTLAPPSTLTPRGGGCSSTGITGPEDIDARKTVRAAAAVSALSLTDAAATAADGATAGSCTLTDAMRVADWEFVERALLAVLQQTCKS